MDAYLFRNGVLWVAHIPTAFGAMECLCGQAEYPDQSILKLVEIALEDKTDFLKVLRRKALLIAFLWRPTRFAVNNEGRLGVQFKNKLTGRQTSIYFFDQYTEFQTRLSEILVSPSDKNKLQSRKRPP